MPSLSNHQSNLYTKCLFIGDSKSGKTGALTSLVAAGYKLRILDFDNGLDVLKQFVLNECPDKIGNVEYRTLQDKRKGTSAGSIIDGSAQAFIRGIEMLDKWKYKEGTEIIDLGKPYQWGPDCILVLDSLSRFSDAAYDWQEQLVVPGKSGLVDNRAAYFEAQKAVIDAIQTVTGDNFETNVIIIAHVRYMEIGGTEDPKTGKMVGGISKGFPQSVGSAICSQIPQFFNSYALFENSGGKRTLRTTSTSLIDLANPKPFAMAKSYPISTGLADFFAVLRDGPKQEVPKLAVRRV